MSFIIAARPCDWPAETASVALVREDDLAQVGKRRGPLDRRQRQPSLDRRRRCPSAGLRRPIVRLASATARRRSQSKPSSQQRCAMIVLDRLSGSSISARIFGSIVSRGPSAASASGRRAHACRYSTAPPSPRRRLRHCTSRISASSPLLFRIGHQVGERPPHQLLLGAALDRLEAGHDPGFGRKRREQGLREAVDGLDLQPARAVEHPGEQLPRALDASPGRDLRRSANRSFASSLS